MAPIKIGVYMSYRSGPAVTATSPPKAPFKIMVISNSLYLTYISIPAISAPASPAVFVFIMVFATKFAFSTLEIEPTEPPLNPNQPIHNKNAPKTTRGIFDAGITLILPFT